MYILSQLCSFFSMMLSNNFNGPAGGPSEQAPVPYTPESSEKKENPNLDPETQEALSALQEQLDGIKNDRTFVTGYLGKIGDFLEGVRNGEYPDLDPNDSEFVEMLGRYDKKLEELEKLSNEGHQIEMLISKALHDLGQDISRQSGVEFAFENSQEKPIEFNQEQKQEIDTLYTEALGYKEAANMKITQAQSQGISSDQFERIITQIRAIDVESEGMEFDERKRFLEQGSEILQQLHVDLDIILRDNNVVGENGEKLGEIRETSTNEKYEEILQNEDIKEKLTARGSDQPPTFEELQAHHITILRDEGVNLAELFLVDEQGNPISESFAQGDSFIVNFLGNKDLERSLNFSFLIGEFDQITVNGTIFEYKDGVFQSEGQKLPIPDGSKVVLGQKFEGTDEEVTERNTQIEEAMNRHGINSTQRAAYHEALMSPDPDAGFEGLTLPGGFEGFFLKLLLEIFDGKKFEYDEESDTYNEVNGDELTNGELVDEGSSQYYSHTGEVVDITQGLENQSEGVRGLVSIVYQAESRGNPNIIYSGSPIQPPKPITQMTVREVRAFQERMVEADSKSSAVGATQVIRKTLEAAVNSGLLDWDEKFDMEAQNRFTLGKMNERGLDRYIQGKMSKSDFMLSLSQEWASLPKDASGASYYSGDGLNKAGVSYAMMSRQLDKIRET